MAGIVNCTYPFIPSDHPDADLNEFESNFLIALDEVGICLEDEITEDVGFEFILADDFPFATDFFIHFLEKDAFSYFVTPERLYLAASQIHREKR